MHLMYIRNDIQLGNQYESSKETTKALQVFEEDQQQPWIYATTTIYHREWIANQEEQHLIMHGIVWFQPQSNWYWKQVSSMHLTRCQWLRRPRYKIEENHQEFQQTKPNESLSLSAGQMMMEFRGSLGYPIHSTFRRGEVDFSVPNIGRALNPRIHLRMEDGTP